jgi:hypothetical protein
MEKLRVVIEVAGGVAYVTHYPAQVEVEIIDHDDESAPEKEES